ncbi:MAG: response regulator [Desulfobulbaceae bacterium]|nr:response regulator [Desulfobulbaceae bacterium]
MTILSVDDSTTIRRIIKKNVTDAGLEVLEAADGAAALKILEESGDIINLIVLDWNMPGMTGLETLKQIKANPRYDGIKIIMLTSEADQHSTVEALRAGADSYLTKPFDGKILMLKIQEALEPKE